MTDIEFAHLMSLRKEFVTYAILPSVGSKGSYDICSVNTEDRFVLDVFRSKRIEINKYTIQNRYAVDKQPLVRIDINGPTHRNPDGVLKSRCHIHVFREAENDMLNLPWAYELDEVVGLSLRDLDFMVIFEAFCKYCNISTANVQRVVV